MSPLEQSGSQTMVAIESTPDVAAKLKDITVDPKTVSGTVTLKGAPAPEGN